MKTRLPPRYVNVRADATYNHDLSDAIFRSLARLSGLAWQDQANHQLPLMTEAELLGILNCKRSTLWGHLQALKTLGLLTWICIDGRFSIRIMPPRRVQSFGLSNDDVDSYSDSENLTESSTTSRVQNFGLTENLQALAAYGIEISSEETRQIASLEHVSPEFIQAWATHLHARHPDEPLSSWLIYQLQVSTTWPTPENRGGARPVRQTVSLPAPIPEAIRSGLEEIGWSDATDEIEAAYQKNPDRVVAWLAFAQNVDKKSIRRSRAAFFRHSLRQGGYPPYSLQPKVDEQSMNELIDQADENESSADTDENASTEAAQVWQAVLLQLERSVSRGTFNKWIRTTRSMSLENNVFVVQASNQDSCDWLTDNLTTTVTPMLAGILNQPITVQFVCADQEPEK